MEVNPVVIEDINFRLIDEFDVNNNSIEKEVDCQLLGPDLTITALEVNIISEADRDKLQVDVTIKNIGNATSNSATIVSIIKSVGGMSQNIGPLLPNEEDTFTITRNITGEINKTGERIIGRSGLPLLIGKDYEIRTVISIVSPPDINTSNNVMRKEFTYTTLPRAGLFITPLASFKGPISIQLCADEPLNVLSSIIMD